MSTIEQIKTDVITKEQTDINNKIILFNDDINTFDYVIDMLVNICQHTPLQAEQCAILVHYKGKCSIKKGNYKKLKPQCIALLEAGLTAEIQ